MSFFQHIVESGTSPSDSLSRRRVIMLSNYVSLILCVPSFLIFFLIPNNINWGGFRELVIGVAIFCVPIVLNRFKQTSTSRLYLCIMPPVLITWYMTRAMQGAPTFPVSTYDGLRIYLLATCCFPYLLLGTKRLLYFASGVLPSFVCLVFLDQILELANVGFSVRDLPEPFFNYNLVRSVISYVIISASCFALKFLAEKSDQRNQQLLAELESKNRLIQDRAATELEKLNETLFKNLEELRNREFVLTKSQQMANIGSWEYDYVQQRVFWSQEMYDIYGLDPGFDVQNSREVLDLYEPSSRGLVREMFVNLRDGKSDQLDITVQVITPLGYRKWVHLTGYRLDVNRQRQKVLGLAHDVTMIREADDRLRASENKYRSLFEQASDPIVICDLEGQITDANASLLKVFGYTRTELLQMKIGLMIDPTQLADRPIRWDLLRSGDQIFNERRMIRKDGSMVEVEANVKMFGANSIMAIIRDVTELRKIQRQIQENEARFRGAFDFSAIGMALVSLEGRWTKVNKKLCAILEYTPEELTQLTFQEITHPDDLGSDLGFLNRALRGEIDHYYLEKRYFKASGATVWVNLSVSLVRDSNRNPLYFVSQVEDITEWKRIEAENERARHLLSERVKELMTLARVSQILQEEGKPIERVLQEIAEVLPGGWQYPEITAARITVGAVQFVSRQFETFSEVQSAHFPCPDQHEGVIEVFYVEEKPAEQEGPFLKEERDLIDLVAERLRAYFAHQHEAERVRTSEANLHATINNTNILVWTVDREFRLLIFNEAFRSFVKSTFHRDVSVGSRAFTGDLSNPELETRDRWVDRYERALAGEVFTLEDQRWNRHFRYSLNPVRQYNEIVGVAVFGEDITERVQQEKELLEANQKIGELKLMALRSVMNPHFIFNALNSIQFFIAKNDRQNAINYLSTFSKLVRGILTHSVNNYVLLADELEMLRHYIHLEMVRFENKFDYVLNVAPDVDVDGIEIPSLLIQPYVENAILHGLYNKEGRGLLQIDVRVEEEAILFEINDDGIGREAAMRLRSEHLPRHKSMGSQLTEERLRLINKQESVHLEIIDKYVDNLPTGTCVKIRIHIDR